MSRTSSYRRSSVLRMLALGCAVLGSVSVLGQAGLPDYEIKAAFLYHFTQFIEWPSDNADRFVICIAGDAALHTSLEGLTRGKFVGSRSIRVKEVKDPEETHACQLVFLGSSLTSKIPRYLAAVHESQVLTVGDRSGFRDQGGMIELFLEDNRIRFDINEQALLYAHLRASSRLLRLARRVEPVRAGGAQ